MARPIKPTDPDKSQPFYVRPYPELRERVVTDAQADHRTISNFIIKILLDYYRQQDEPKTKQKNGKNAAV